MSPQEREVLSNEDLHRNYLQLVEELYVYESAPYDVPLPEEWYVGRASLEDRAFELVMESCRRERWTGERRVGSEPPLPIPDL